MAFEAPFILLNSNADETRRPGKPQYWASSRERSRLGSGGFSASLMMLDSPDDDGSENAFSSRFKTRLLQSLYNLLVYLFLLFYNPVRKLMPKFISPWDF